MRRAAICFLVLDFNKDIIKVNKIKFTCIIRLAGTFKTSWRHLENVLMMSWRCLEDMLTRAAYLRDTSWWHLKDFMKMFWTCLEDIFARCLEDVLKTYEQYICLSQEILKMPWRHLLKTYDQGLYIRLDQDVLKTSSRYCLKTKSKDILKTSSPSGMFAEIELCI